MIVILLSSILMFVKPYAHIKESAMTLLIYLSLCAEVRKSLVM